MIIVSVFSRTGSKVDEPVFLVVENIFDGVVMKDKSVGFRYKSGKATKNRQNQYLDDSIEYSRKHRVMMKSFEPDPNSLHHVTEESIAEERKLVEQERQKRIKFLEEKQTALEKILAVVENYPNVEQILSGSEKLYHVEVPEHENVISVKTSSGAYKNIEREIERIVDDLEILDSFSDDENDEEADGFFDVSQIKQLIEKSEKIMSMERISPLDSVDGRHVGYDKFDAIKDEIDNDSGSYESALGRLFDRILQFFFHVKIFNYSGQY
jgi:hypothetical protein